MFEDAFREAKGGVTISVHIVPRASRSGLAGMHGGSVKLRIKAPPVEGAANRELARFLGEQLELPAAQIELISGAGSRQKLVLVRGMTLGTVMARLRTPG